MKRSGWIIFIPAAFFFILNFAVSSVKTLFFSRFIYFLFLISLFFFLRQFSLNKILKSTLGGVSLIIFSYGIIQKFVLFPYYLKNITPEKDFYIQAVLTRIKSGRIFAIFTLPTLYAIVCALLILFIFHYLLKSASGIERFFWSFLLILGLGNLVLTQSFGGILCLSAGIFLYLILSRILNLKFLVPTVMVLALFFFLITGLRFSEAKKMEPVKLRMSNWAQAIRMIGANLYWGQGLGNYESEISYFTYPGEARSIYAHNFFLQFTAESGIFIPFFILALLFCYRKKLKPRDCKKDEKTLYISAFLILLLYNLIDIGFYFFAAGIAGAICLSQVYPHRSKNIKLNAVVLIFLSAFLLAESISDTFQRRGEYRLHRKDYIEAEINYKKSLVINPFNLRAMMGYSQIYYDKTDYSRCEYYLDKIREIYPDSSFANALKAKVAYEQRKYCNSLYFIRTAYLKDRLRDAHKRQYELIKNNLQAELAKPQD